MVMVVKAMMNLMVIEIEFDGDRDREMILRINRRPHFILGSLAIALFMILLGLDNLLQFSSRWCLNVCAVDVVLVVVVVVDVDVVVVVVVVRRTSMNMTNMLVLMMTILIMRRTA